MKADVDWSNAPGPWHILGPEIAAALKRLAGSDALSPIKPVASHQRICPHCAKDCGMPGPLSLHMRAKHGGGY